MSKPKQLPSGAWRVRWLDHEGKRQSAVFASAAAARAGLRQALVERDNIRSGLRRPRADETVEAAAEEWLKARPTKRRKANAAHLDRHILPFMGKTPLAEVTPDLLQRFIRHLESAKTARRGEKNTAGRTLAAATIANVLITLRKLMNDCGHPIKVAHKVPTSGYGWIRDTAQVAHFLSECKPAWFRTACAIAVYGGLRKGEVAALQRDALDFERGLIRVDRSYDGPTKSQHMRWAPLAPALAAVLKPWLLEHPGRFVVTVEGEPIVEGYDLAARTRRACKRAGIDSVNFHQLRHTAASHLAQRVPLPIVGAILGHADPKTTSRYAHLDTESLARSARVHLDFTAPAGEVVTLPVPTALKLA